MPDVPDLLNPGAIQMDNVVPGAGGAYLPFPAHSSSSNSLTARPRGAILTFDLDGNQFSYAGDATKLYELVTNTWTDRSKAGGYSLASTDHWEFATWKDQLLAVGGLNVNIQEVTFGAANFADLTALQARAIAVVRDFVVIGNTSTSKHNVRWSAFNDATDWTVDPATGADSRDLKIGGAILRILGGEYGVIVSERSVFRMTFVGAPVWFQIDEVLPHIGAISPGSVVQHGDIVYFWSQQGFVALQGGIKPTFIGAGKVDEFFRNDLDELNDHRISSAVDPSTGRVFWAYPAVTNGEAGRPNKLACYDPRYNRWTIISDVVELIYSWNSQTVPQLAAFNSSFAVGFYDGTSKAAVMKTGFRELVPGHRARIDAFRPLIETSSGQNLTVLGEINSKSNAAPASNNGGSVTMSNGTCARRANDRYMAFTILTTGDFEHALGVAVDRVHKGGRRN